MIPVLEHSWLNILGLQVGTHFLFIFQYKRCSLSTFKKTRFHFLSFLHYSFSFQKKQEDSIFIMIIIQEICSQELWSFTWHGVATCLVCQKLCTGLFTCPYGAKTIALPAWLPCTGLPSVPTSQSHLYSWCTVGTICNFQNYDADTKAQYF